LGDWSYLVKFPPHIKLGCKSEAFFRHGVNGTLLTKLCLFVDLKRIDWQSVFRDCAEVVRLFKFQGKLFQLQFKVEQASNQEETVSVHSTGPNDGSTGGGDHHSGPGDGMDTDRNGNGNYRASSKHSRGKHQSAGDSGGFLENQTHE
jgi:hypothetical protein